MSDYVNNVRLMSIIETSTGPIYFQPHKVSQGLQRLIKYNDILFFLVHLLVPKRDI